MVLNPTTLSSEPAYHGDQRSRLPVIGSDNGTPVNGNATLSAGTSWPSFPARELWLSNDSSSTLTITFTFSDGSTLAFIMNQGENFDERMPPFNAILIAASGEWRWRVRGNLT